MHEIKQRTNVDNKIKTSHEGDTIAYSVVKYTKVPTQSNNNQYSI